MKLLDGLHAAPVYRMRRARPPKRGGSWGTWKQVDASYYLAWRPGTDADAMWWEHSAAVFGQQFAERLTRSA